MVSIPLSANRVSHSFRAPCLKRQCSRTHRRLVLGAGSGDVGSSRISIKEAQGILGVQDGSTFDEIVQAKNRLTSQLDTNSEKYQEIEAAYDVLFMQSMKKRLSGEVQVSTSVRFADVQPLVKKDVVQRGFNAPKFASSSSSVPTLKVEVPKPNIIATRSAVFAALSVWVLTQVLLEPPEAQLADTAGFQLALALAYSAYTFKKDKQMSLGKTVGVSFGTVVVTAIVGSVIHNWLRVDIVPLAGFGSPGGFVTEFIITGLWLVTLFIY